MNNKNTAVIYLRWSADDGETTETNSITNQRLILQSFAEELNLEIIDEYCDDGFSGTSDRRPEFQRLKRDVESGLISHILCKDLSRFSRSARITLEWVNELLPKNKTHIITKLDNIDSRKGYSAITGFYAMVYEFYAADISAKVRAGYYASMKKGNHISGRTPYGYQKDPDNPHKLIVDQGAAKVVKLIFTLALQGKSINSITSYLSKEGILTPNAYHFMLYNKPQNTTLTSNWSRRTVKSILNNPIYTGDMVQHKTQRISFLDKSIRQIPPDEWIIVSNTHEPIIEKELFERVQTLTKIHNRPNKFQESNIFSGLLFCAKCNSKLSYRSDSKAFGEKGYFVCSNYRKTLNCSSHYISSKRLTHSILTTLNEVLESVLDRNILLDIYKKSIATIDISALISQDTKLSFAITKLVEQNVNGVIADEIFLPLYKKYTSQQMSLKSKIESRQREVEPPINIRIGSLDRPTLLEFIEKIIIHDGFGKGSNRHQQVDVFLRFSPSVT